MCVVSVFYFNFNIAGVPKPNQIIDSWSLLTFQSLRRCHSSFPGGLCGAALWVMPPPPPTLLPLSDSLAEITRAGSYLRRRAPGIALFKWTNSTRREPRAPARTRTPSNTFIYTQKQQPENLTLMQTHDFLFAYLYTGSRSRQWHIKLYLSFSYSIPERTQKPHRRQLVECCLLAHCSHIQFA